KVRISLVNELNIGEVFRRQSVGKAGIERVSENDLINEIDLDLTWIQDVHHECKVQKRLGCCSVVGRDLRLDGPFDHQAGLRESVDLDQVEYVGCKILGNVGAHRADVASEMGDRLAGLVGEADLAVQCHPNQTEQQTDGRLVAEQGNTGEALEVDGAKRGQVAR